MHPIQFTDGTPVYNAEMFDPSDLTFTVRLKQKLEILLQIVGFRRFEQHFELTRVSNLYFSRALRTGIVVHKTCHMMRSVLPWAGHGGCGDAAHVPQHRPPAAGRDRLQRRRRTRL